ncbi:MAG: YCF48-related protein [Bacteroidota bacterium]|nr:YCF48-related protein [Bacteroidota bacterium]
MKKLFLITFTLISLSNFASSQSSWFWQNPLPQGNTLNSVKFVNSQTGFAVGNVGTILKTINAGENWTVSNSNYINDLHSLSFTDENTVYACGSDGIILKTTNSGNSWNIISSGTLDTLLSIFFTDSNTGYACGKTGRIIKSSDTGNSWTQQNSGVTNNLNCIYFLNSLTGYTCGNNIILKTTNSGNNWFKVRNTNLFYSIYFINNDTGFFVGGAGNNYLLVKTTNAGNNWQALGLAQSGPLRSIQFINQNTGFISGVSNNFYKTTNSGINWNLNSTISGDGIGLLSVHFPNTTDGYLVGTYGTIFKSTDTGNNWTAKAPQGTLENMNEVNFIDKNTGYILSYGNSSVSNIYKTINSGNNWFSFVSIPLSYNIQFFDNNTGYILTFDINDGKFNLMKTLTGGLSWDIIFKTKQVESYTLYQFIDVNTGFFSQFSNDFYKTTNGGLNWTSQSFSPSYVYLLNFPNHDVGYLTLQTVSGHKLYKTTNTGSNWNFVRDLNFDSTFTRRLYFINATSGFFINIRSNENFKIFKTIDGGMNLYSVFSSGFFFPHIKFINDNTGYITGHPDFLLRTTNQGENWDSIKVADRPINDIEFTDDNTGYFVGGGGMIKKTTTGGVIAIENTSSFIPDEFILEQNYPNPFNPNTVISYQLRVSSFISLKVYDLLGKQVATLINEKQNAGRYSVDFNGSNLPSGIYFYKIETGNFSETRKMILLK